MALRWRYILFSTLLSLFSPLRSIEAEGEEEFHTKKVFRFVSFSLVGRSYLHSMASLAFFLLGAARLSFFIFLAGNYSIFTNVVAVVDGEGEVHICSVP